jgi:16S rRNA (guanine(966)-N(2))-methyltransferase RsmD
MDIRPTTDKVKEALFSVLQFDLLGKRVLDLFAGTGQLGLEALSRGAAFVCFTDASRKAIELVKKNITVTGFGDRSKAVLTDAYSFLHSCRETFDIVLLDPPYEKEMCLKAMEALPSVLNDNAIVVCETRPDEPLPDAVGALKLAKTYHYSNIKLSVYRSPEDETWRR